MHMGTGSMFVGEEEEAADEEVEVRKPNPIVEFQFTPSLFSNPSAIAPTF